MNAATATRILREVVNGALDAGHIAYEGRFQRVVAVHLAEHGVHKGIASFDARSLTAGAIRNRRAEWAERVERATRQCELAYGAALLSLVDDLVEEALDRPGACVLSGYVTRVRRALNERQADTFTDAEDMLWRVLYRAGYRYQEAASVVYDGVQHRAALQVRLAQRITVAAQSRGVRIATSRRKYQLAA